MLALGLLIFAAVWLTNLSLTSLSPPTDNIEQLTWVNSLQWGYYKQPPLPTWLFWLPVWIFGERAETSYLAGAAVTLAAIGLLWRLLVQLRGRRYATLALLAVLCVTYYNQRLSYYNHETVLMLFVTASAALCWRAYTTRHLRWWAALGVALGLGALTKYQVAVTIASLVVFWVQQRSWRDGLHRCGLLLSALVALLLFVPHLRWLDRHDFGPVTYAMASSLGVHLDAASRAAMALHWLADQLLNRALPAWLLLAAAFYRLRRGGAAPLLPTPTATAIGSKQDASRALLLCWGLVPLAFMPLTAIAAGSDLPLHWGTPFLLFAIPAAMELSASRARWSRVSLQPALKWFLVIQALLLFQNYLASPLGGGLLPRKCWRRFDSAKLARLVESQDRAALAGKEICVISGPATIAGALALQMPGHPQVLIDGRYDISPWVRTEQPEHCAVLELHNGPAPVEAIAVGPEFPGLTWRLAPSKPVRAGAIASTAPADRTGPPAHS